MFTRIASIVSVFTVAYAAGCTTSEPTRLTADSTSPIAAADFGLAAREHAVRGLGPVRRV